MEHFEKFLNRFHLIVLNEHPTNKEMDWEMLNKKMCKVFVYTNKLSLLQFLSAGIFVKTNKLDLNS